MLLDLFSRVSLIRSKRCSETNNLWMLSLRILWIIDKIANFSHHDFVRMLRHTMMTLVKNVKCKICNINVSIFRDRFHQVDNHLRRTNDDMRIKYIISTFVHFTFITSEKAVDYKTISQIRVNQFALLFDQRNGRNNKENSRVFLKTILIA